METKRELGEKAKSLIMEKPEESVRLYKELLAAYPDQFNEWDAFNAMKALRACKKPDLNWAKQLATNYKDEKVGNMYGWTLFDHCVKGKNRDELLASERFLTDLSIISPQRNTCESDSYPCPTTICVFNLADAYAENQFNAFKINDLLLNIDHKLLSGRSKTIDNEKKGEIELASDKEKYFALKSKALLKLRAYQECLDLCQLALNTLDKFHYNNDLWFRMRIAISLDKLGKFEESESLFKELLSSKDGSDKWFLYRDIAEIYYENKDFEKAWKHAVNAAYYGNEPHFLINLYLLQARILYKLDRATEGNILAELVGAILKEQGWNVKEEHRKMFNYYKIDLDNLPSVSEIIKDVEQFWNSERYAGKVKKKGIVVSIHRNGKMGRIKDESGNVVDFHKKDLVKKQKTLEQLEKAIVEFYEMKKEDGSLYAEAITVLKKIEKPQHSDDLLGKVFKGSVKNLTEYGIFVHIPNVTDGLMHKNDMPKELRDDFKDKFSIGQKIKVQVSKVSEKGINLSLVQE